MNRILYVEPSELTLDEFKSITKWSYKQIARETGDEERNLYIRIKVDHKDTPKNTQWRKHLALLFKLSFPDFERLYKEYREQKART